MVKKRKQ